MKQIAKCPFTMFSCCRNDCALLVRVTSEDGRYYETCALTMRALWESDEAKCIPVNSHIEFDK